MTTSPDDLTSVTVGQFFPYSAERVWHAITSPASISDWATDIDRDSVVPGKSFAFTTFPLPEVNFSGHGHCEFTDVVPNERLAYRFTTPESSLNLQATWTLHPESGGTRLLVVHNGFDVGNPVHGRLRILVRDLWKLVMSRIGELMAEPKDDAVPRPMIRRHSPWPSSIATRRKRFGGLSRRESLWATWSMITTWYRCRRVHG